MYMYMTFCGFMKNMRCYKFCGLLFSCEVTRKDGRARSVVYLVLVFGVV